MAVDHPLAARVPSSTRRGIADDLTRDRPGRGALFVPRLHDEEGNSFCHGLFQPAGVMAPRFEISASCGKWWSRAVRCYFTEPALAGDGALLPYRVVNPSSMVSITRPSAAATMSG